MADQVQSIFVATESGLSISRNGGKSYRVRRIEHGLGSNFCRSVSAEGQWVFVATTKGLSVSSDNGEHFVNKTTIHGLPDNDCKFVQALDDGSAIVMTDKGAAITRDGGVSFSEFTVENGLLPSNICNDGIFQNNGFIAIGTRNGLAVSRNYGMSFTHHLNGINIVDVSVCHELNTIFVASDTGVYRTPYAFQGAFVGPFTYGLSKFEKIQTITVDEAGVVYIGTDKHLYYSKDKGVTFNTMKIGMSDDTLYTNVRDIKALRNSFFDLIHMGEGEDLEDTTAWGFHSDIFDHDVYYSDGSLHIKFQNKKYPSSWVDAFIKPQGEDTITLRMTKNNSVHSISIPQPAGTILQYWFKYEDVSVESPESEIFSFVVPGFRPNIVHRVTRRVIENKTRIWFKVINGVPESISVTFDNETRPMTENINGWVCVDFDNIPSTDSKYSFNFVIDDISYSSTEYKCRNDSSLVYSISEQHVFPNNARIEINGLEMAQSVLITYIKDSTNELVTYIPKTVNDMHLFNFPGSASFKNIRYSISAVIDDVSYCSDVRVMNAPGYTNEYSFDIVVDEFTGDLIATFSPINFNPESVRFVFNGVTSDIVIGSSGSYQFESRLDPDQSYYIQFFFTIFAQEFATETKSGVYTPPTPAQRLAHYLANSTNGTPSSGSDVALNGGAPDTEFEFAVSGSI